MQIYFAAVLIAVGVGCLVALILALRPDGGARRLKAYAQRAELPVPQASETALLGRMRRAKIVEMSSALAACAISGAILATPFGATALFPLTVLLPVVLVTTLLGSTALALREQLFSPTPDEPRVARAQVVRGADYLDGWQRAVTWVLAALATAGLVWVAIDCLRGVAPHPEAAPVMVAMTVVALGSVLAAPFVEAAIARRPQPAATPLELAWDDALRTSAMHATRFSAGVLCVTSVLLSSLVLLPNPGSPATWPLSLVVIAQVVLSRVYPTTGSPLPRRLFPQGIHVAAGSTV